jgi:hypothetical protein
MKNENEFNAHLAAEFRKIRNAGKLGVKKLSERFEAGASDFLLVKEGKCLLLECKFIKEFPVKPDTQVLGHQFTGPQLKFMDDLALGGALGYGLVAIKPMHAMMLIPREVISTGNWSLRDFSRLSFEYGRLMGWGQIGTLLSSMLGKPIGDSHVLGHHDMDWRFVTGGFR